MIEFRVYNKKQSLMQWIMKEIERRERHKQLYWFLPQPESSLVPLALQRRVH